MLSLKIKKFFYPKISTRKHIICRSKYFKNLDSYPIRNEPFNITYNEFFMDHIKEMKEKGYIKEITSKNWEDYVFIKYFDAINLKLRKMTLLNSLIFHGLIAYAKKEEFFFTNKGIIIDGYNCLVDPEYDDHFYNQDIIKKKGTELLKQLKEYEDSVKNI